MFFEYKKKDEMNFINLRAKTLLMSGKMNNFVENKQLSL